jgi:DNA-binding transcriptional regulator LsrR (DeoR family)
MSRTDELRMMVRVAQLYYEDKLKQADISKRIHTSQATVSRLLKRAEEEGVLRVTIVAPRGHLPPARERIAGALRPQ